MPISLVRRFTAYAIRPYRPTLANSNARAPNALDSEATKRSCTSESSSWLQCFDSEDGQAAIGRLYSIDHGGGYVGGRDGRAKLKRYARFRRLE